MNILFLTTHVNAGGITSYILTLGESLVKSGHKVIVVSSGGDSESFFVSLGVRHIKIDIRTKSEMSPKLLFSIPTLIKLIANEEIHIIHAQTRVTQVLGYWLNRLTGVKMITTCHGFFRPRWFRRAFPCWGSGVIAISKPVEGHLIKDFNVSPNKIHLVSNGINLNKFQPTTKEVRQALRQRLSMGDVPLIGIIARLSDVKGIDVLIKAMLFVLKEIPSAKLIIVGEGPHEAYLKKLTHELSLTDYVYFKDTVNQTSDLLGAFDVFVMPSLMEGLGLSVIEAQACGIPVVVSRVGGLIDLIEDGKTGYLVPVGDPTLLANRIVEVLRNPQQSSVMARQARLNIEEYFSSQVMLNKTLKVYEQYSSR